MRIPDYHVHTHFSPDSAMQPRDAVAAAIKAGITDICFTEHMDLGHHLGNFNRLPDFESMRNSVMELREEFGEINIHYGLEAGYIKETAEETAKVLAEEQFDYVLLSTHCVDGLDCYLPESKRGRDKEYAYRRYLETVYDSVTDTRLTQYYDCVGHIGYIAKCKHYEDNTFPYEMFPELFDKILSEIIQNGKGIEVNTSGIKRAGHILPHPSILTRYYELGVRVVTIGSDAHRPEAVGSNIQKILEQLKNCGFNEIVIYNNRRYEFIRM